MNYLIALAVIQFVIILYLVKQLHDERFMSWFWHHQTMLSADLRDDYHRRLLNEQGKPIPPNLRR